MLLNWYAHFQGHFYSKINISLCSLSKSLYFPHDDICDNRTVCWKHRVTLNFSQAYTCPWKRFFLSTQQCTPMAHTTAWKACEERVAEMLCKEPQFGNKATNPVVGNKVYNHEKTITNKCCSSDTLLSSILFCSPQLWLSATVIRNPRQNASWF